MESAKVELKKTVNLPQTGFSMKANLGQLEPKLLAKWGDEGLYERIREARKGRPTYILHDGPPYANGNIHLGHALNKLLKDFIVRLKNMEGYDSPYIPGWDCHGLPIEFQVDNELGGKKAGMTPVQIRAACRKYAEKYVDLQRKDFMRLGILGRWQDPYLTMSPDYEALIAQTFVDFLEGGYVYKGLKPVNWCIRDRTALAEAEIEYENHSSPSIWVRFALTSKPEAINPLLLGREVFGLIWTTTPWTIPANLAISFHPKYRYVGADVNGDVYIVAKDLLAQTAEACGWESYPVVAEFAGAQLDKTVFRHPFIERDSLGILGDHVTLEQGTGAVHTAPGHGQEDYVVAQAHGIPTYCPVDAAGRFYHVDGAPGRLPEELIGKSVWDANSIVMEILKKASALVAHRKIDHSYPHCWRCHQPTIFRATEQWFVGMDRGIVDGKSLRERALDAIKTVKWKPEWGEGRISNMIAGRPDWCISRQRVWGVPIIIFYCEACNETVADRAVFDRVIDRFRKHSADAWYSMTVEELAGPGLKCSKCGGTTFRKETDILDVWLDSGVSHLAVLNESNHLPWPSDLYLEGGDQYRGWFHSSLLVAVALRNAAPYRATATNGWTLDGEGHAMSKSRGSEAVEKITNKYGADLLRLWTASIDFTEDVRLSDTILERLIEAYRKLRNTLRYALGNLFDFDPGRDAVLVEEMLEIDRWILARMEGLIQQCRASYDAFEFHKVYRAIYDFATTDLSAVYFDVLKDRLYTAGANSRSRRSGQTALYRVHYALVRLMAPFLAFTTEEAWGFTAKPAGAPDSVHLTLLPEPDEMTHGLDAAKLADWDALMQAREPVLKALEEARQAKLIGTSLEARVRLGATDLLRRYERDLPMLFIVSQVALDSNDRIVIERADGQKCERCWKYTTRVGEDADFPTACEHCVPVLKEMS